MTEAEREAWEERMGLCTQDGQQSEQDAREVADAMIQRMRDGR